MKGVRTPTTLREANRRIRNRRIKTVTVRRVASEAGRQRLPEWISAVSTLVQTLAVLATVMFAYYQFEGQSRKDEGDRLSATLRFSSEQTQDFVKARAKLEEAYSVLMCLSLISQFQPLHNADCFEGGIRETIQADTLPLVERYREIDICLKGNICDYGVASKMFCEDAVRLQQVLARFDALPFDDEVLADFFKVCGTSIEAPVRQIFYPKASENERH